MIVGRDATGAATRALVVVHGIGLSNGLADVVAARCGGAGSTARIIVPAVAASRPQDWLAAGGDPRRAETTLRGAVGALRARGIQADGRLGDADPLRAIEDALDGFGPDSVLLVTGPGADWSETERALWRARRRIGAPVLHLDGAADGVQETLQVVHSCPSEESGDLAKGRGFRDRRVAGSGDGVLLLDRAVESVLADDTLGIVSLEIPLELALRHEIGRGEGGERRFLVPSGALNASAHVLGPVV